MGLGWVGAELRFSVVLGFGAGLEMVLGCLLACLLV